MTGAVWNACKRMTNISDSNKKACMKESLRYVSIVRDVCKECKEYIENKSDDDWDGLLDDEDLEGAVEIDDEDVSEEMEETIVDSISAVQSVLETVFKLMQLFGLIHRLYSSSLPEVTPVVMVNKLDAVSLSVGLL